MAEILENTMIVPNLHLVTLAAPEIAEVVQPGQFVILRVEEDGERIPLTVSDWDTGRARSAWFTRTSAKRPRSWPVKAPVRFYPP